MNSFIDKLSGVLIPISQKISNNRFISAIAAGFNSLLPIIIVGALASLFANLQIGPYQDFVTATHLKEIFGFVPTVTTNLLALYSAFMIAHALADNLNLKGHEVLCGATALVSFLVLIPQGVTGTTAGGEELTIPAALSMQYLGAAGLFCAIIVALVVPVIYNQFIVRNITIKLPPQVPPMIAKSFSSMIPSFVIFVLFAAIRFGMSFTPFGDMNTMVYSLIQTPLQSLGASPFAFMLLLAMCSLCWFVGINGGAVVNPMLTLLYLPLALENVDAMSAGLELPNILSYSIWSVGANLGGGGATLGLCIALAFVTKSERYKTLGRLSLPASLCGINEPLMFGTPIVLNVMLLIPLIITPLVVFGITYLSMLFGLIPFFNGVQVPIGTPIILSGLLSCGWQMAVLQVLLVVVEFFMYLPFVKALDRQEQERESAEQASAEAAA